MGIPDSSLQDLIQRVRSWISCRASGSCSSSGKLVMENTCCKTCCQCDMSFSEVPHRFHCQRCGRWLCANCFRRCQSYIPVLKKGKDDSEVGENIDLCQPCSAVNMSRDDGSKRCEKIYPASSPRKSCETLSPSLSYGLMRCSIIDESIQSHPLDQYLEEQDFGCSPQAVTARSMSFVSAQPSPVSVCHSPGRSDEEEAYDSGRHYFSPSSDYFRDRSDIDSISICARHECYNFPSMASSPTDSPARIKNASSRVGNPVQQGQEGSLISQNDGPLGQKTQAVLKRPESGTDDRDITDGCSDDLSSMHNQYEKLERPLDFEKNGPIWFPPPPEDEEDEESNFFPYEEEDDDFEDSNAAFSISSSLSSMFPAREKLNEDNKERLRAVVQGHFRALVAQLLQGEGIKDGKENGVEEWLDIATKLAWQAANFVKPDTSGGGSMDPGDYVKVKCIASGNPSESTLIKGVVCTKNVKHKRMNSQYKNARLLLIGGALEYERTPNQLASFDKLLQQEDEYFKMIVSKIEALRANVLLVERSVSSCAQEYLLAKEISLVLNVKRPLLERIARCTGASITPSVDNISTARLGHCELFRLERVSEEHENANQLQKKTSKTLMFFEGCPRRLGCTVLLKGMSYEELKKVKHVVQYAVFAAYHLSLETSFLADEGASLPKLTLKPSVDVPDKSNTDISSSFLPNSVSPTGFHEATFAFAADERVEFNPELEEPKSFSMCHNPENTVTLSAEADVIALSEAYNDVIAPNLGFDPSALTQLDNLSSDINDLYQPELQDSLALEKMQSGYLHESSKSCRIDENDASSEYLSVADTHQSILVSFSSHCVLKGTVCERSRLVRIKFYGCFDKPLGRYLRDDLFDQASLCQSCKEPAEAHVLCYTHQQGNLTINVRQLTEKLSGEKDGRIWMWHRCLRCAHVDGVPPATRRVIMSDAAWGLSFGKFLELSFSNHATANRVAACGHSLQRDCLRFYGYGNMVAFFMYSPINILSVHLPPSILEFDGVIQPEWIRKEASEVINKMETLYAEISDVIDSLEQKGKYSVQNLIRQLKDQLKKERNQYIGSLKTVMIDGLQEGQVAVDKLNRLMRSLLVGSYCWDHRLYSFDALLKKSFVSNAKSSSAKLKDSSHDDSIVDYGCEENIPESSKSVELLQNGTGTEQKEKTGLFVDSSLMLLESNGEEMYSDEESMANETLLESFDSNDSTLSEIIDSAWSGADQFLTRAQIVNTGQTDETQNDRPYIRRLLAPVRVQSFDSALRIQERIERESSPLSTFRSFNSDLSNSSRAYVQGLSPEARLKLVLGSTPSFISCASHMAEGVHLLLPQTGNNDMVIAVYDNEPTSIISYALSSREYEDWIFDKLRDDGGWSITDSNVDNSAASTISAWQSFGSQDLDFIYSGRYASEDSSASVGSLFTNSKKSPHFRISFGDESFFGGGKVKFSVTCYFAKQFDSLRKKCCPNEVDFIRSLSRCRRWSAQGGKSNVYFAKSLDERFIIKQVTKTELDSFEEFATEYFKYLSYALSSGSPTCLAKILGIFQVTVKHLKGGKETKMDLMVMENLFFKRSISKVYDLKGSARSRYNPDTSGANKVLLDMNLLETLCTQPIFLGSKAKRSLERPIWNDTSFLASIDVMDYSLLVGVDEEKKQLVLGIIDYVRQYTWDKHLETWVKASGILGGPMNAPPTIISPKQYKKRFRKAMTTYFLTVPDQWPS